MADTKFTGLTENTTPLTTDIMPMVDDPGGTPLPQKITLTSLRKALAGTVLTCIGSFGTVDATTYYIGNVDVDNISTVAAVHRVYVPVAGTVTKIYGSMWGKAVSVSTSTEQSTISFRLNNTTDTSITTTFVTPAAAAVSTFSNVALSIAVVAGDYFEIKWVTPTWATNPDASLLTSAVVYIE